MKTTLLIILMLTFSLGYSQITKKESKAIEKSIKLYKDKKYDKAIDKLAPVLETHKDNKKLWEINIEIYYQNYLATYNSMNSLVNLFKEIDIENEDGTTSKLSISSNGNFGFDDFIYQCSRSTLLIENITSSNVYLRNFLVDVPVDTAISKEAKAAFNGAEVEFQKRNFSNAIELYNKALDIEPNYYKASMYLGDCHWAAGRPAKAIDYFKDAVKKQPMLLEPRKYITDAYIDLKELDKALVSCIEGIIVFPDSDMFRRVSDICYEKGMEFNRQWMPRDLELNEIGSEQKAVESTPWRYYREAKSKIQPFCDGNGVIIKQTDLTKQLYLESYCWEYMLANTKDQQFDFARKAMEGGYLDCFSLISMYHISLHSQFEHFAQNNDSKIKDYFHLMLISEK